MRFKCAGLRRGQQDTDRPTHGNNKHTKSIINRQWKSTNGEQQQLHSFCFFLHIAWCIKSFSRMSSKSRTRRSLHETSRQRNVVTGTCFAICSGMFSAWSEIKKEYQNERNNFFVWKAEIKMVEETEPSFFSAFFHSLVRCGKFFRNPAALSGIAGEFLGTTDEACEGWNKAWIIDVDRKQSEKKVKILFSVHRRTDDGRKSGTSASMYNKEACWRFLPIDTGKKKEKIFSPQG